jgi:hypothetical protein
VARCWGSPTRTGPGGTRHRVLNKVAVIPHDPALEEVR